MKLNFDRFKFKSNNSTQSIDNQINIEEKQTDNRRDFIKKASLSGLGLGLMFDSKPEQEMEFITQKIKRAGKPSDLKITDVRIAVLTGIPTTCPILRIDTNQGISGYGEIRNGASVAYGSFLKSQILGKNPCDVEKTFKLIKRFAGQDYSVGGIEMALWDLAGKAYNVPAYQMLGGKFRENIRIYGNTSEINDPSFAKKVKEKIDSGLTFLKMNLAVQFLENKSKDLEIIANHVAKVREVIGYEIPLAAENFGQFDVNTAIRLANALEKYKLAWLEDLVPWQLTEQWKQVSNSIDTPTITGKKIHLKDDFIKLINARAVDMIQPDLVNSGGLLGTKKIGDYAQEHGVAMAMHSSGTPISFMANIHCAAATENFVALEHQGIEWKDLFIGEKPIVDNGFVKVPEKSGLGIELNEIIAKTYFKSGKLYFAPTEEWNKIDSWS
jgi:L-alanine-DL-glutamate epimerase-like enolase superfamily enzyme